MLRVMLVLSLLAVPALVGAQEKSGRATEKAGKAQGDDRLDALEEKLQALLKEIQALRAGKDDTRADEMKKARAARFADEKMARDKAEAAADIEKRTRAARIGDEKKVREKAEGGEKPKVIRIGDDGKSIELNFDDLKKLGTLKLDVDQLKKLEGMKLDIDQLKKLGAAELDKLKGAQMDKLKLAEQLDKLKAAQLDKLHLADLEKLKGAKVELGEKMKDLADMAKKVQGAENKRIVVDAGTGKIVRTEELPGTTRGRATNTTTYTTGDPDTVHLTRVTYTLGGQQARALDEFLKAFAKAKVLETKIDGDKLIVTTTPDVQATIGQVVSLMTGKPASGAHRYSTTVTGPGTTMSVKPATPLAPSTVEKATKPAKPAKPKDKDKDKDKDDDE